MLCIVLSSFPVVWDLCLLRYQNSRTDYSKCALIRHPSTHNSAPVNSALLTQKLHKNAFSKTIVGLKSFLNGNLGTIMSRNNFFHKNLFQESCFEQKMGHTAPKGPNFKNGEKIDQNGSKISKNRSESYFFLQITSLHAS